jgi:hypothetical protein
VPDSLSRSHDEGAARRFTGLADGFAVVVLGEVSGRLYPSLICLGASLDPDPFPRPQRQRERVRGGTETATGRLAKGQPTGPTIQAGQVG